MICPALSTGSRCYQAFNTIIWRTLESAEALGRRKVYFCFYYKFKLWFCFFFQSLISYFFRLGSSLESYRRDRENRRQISPLFTLFFFLIPCCMSVVISRADLNEISDWHLADLNPSWLNLCNTAVTGVYQ